MSRLMPPVAMAPGNSRARSVRPRVQPQRQRRIAPRAEALRPADFGFGPLFLHTRDAVIVGNIDTGRIVLWNPAAEQLFGYTAPEVIGQPITMLIPPAIARLHHEGLARYRQTGERTVIGSRPMEVPARTRSGEEIRVELSLVALESPLSSPRQYVLAMLRDASERKRAELQSLEAARAEAARQHAERVVLDQAQLLCRGLDELRRPLARLESSVARATQPGAPRARVVARRVDVLRRALRHLADATGIRSGTLELHPERLNLVPLMARVVSSVRTRTAVHKISTALPQGLTALVDAERVEQVVETLLGQAMQRNPRGCWIDVDLRRPLVGLAQIEVRDYGRAVTDEEIQRLLESDGASFGLAVSRWIVEQHGGTLTVESPGEGGLRVIVTLPTQRGRVSGA
jgi:two-component system sensor kinase FixL